MLQTHRQSKARPSFAGGLSSKPKTSTSASTSSSSKQSSALASASKPTPWEMSSLVMKPLPPSTTASWRWRSSSTTALPNILPGQPSCSTSLVSLDIKVYNLMGIGCSACLISLNIIKTQKNKYVLLVTSESLSQNLLRCRRLGGSSVEGCFDEFVNVSGVACFWKAVLPGFFVLGWAAKHFHVLLTHRNLFLLSTMIHNGVVDSIICFICYSFDCLTPTSPRVKWWWNWEFFFFKCHMAANMELKSN